MEAVTQGKFQARLGYPAASESEVAHAESVRGCRFDPSHRSFLMHADGWDSFAGPGLDLFSTADFVGSARFADASKWIAQMDRRVLGAYAKHRHQLLPIGKSAHSTDLFVMQIEGGRVAKPVAWFANELIEQFESFPEMFVSMREIRRAANERIRMRS
jgi:hypothetical protein